MLRWQRLILVVNIKICLVFGGDDVVVTQARNPGTESSPYLNKAVK